MKTISFKEFSTGISYLQSPDEEIQQLGIRLFDLHDIKFHKLYHILQWIIKDESSQ